MGMDRELSIFWPGFGVRSTQTLVKIYNIQLNLWITVQITLCLCLIYKKSCNIEHNVMKTSVTTSSHIWYKIICTLAWWNIYEVFLLMWENLYIFFKVHYTVGKLKGFIFFIHSMSLSNKYSGCTGRSIWSIFFNIDINFLLQKGCKRMSALIF